MDGNAQVSSLLTHDVAQNGCQLLSQLWSCGGLTANRAAPILAAIPVLKKLLQPIVAGETEGDLKGESNAYCLRAPLLDAYNQLSQLGEWQLVLLGLSPEVRAHWLNLAAARCREAGAMNDPQVLVKLIQQLGNASEWVFTQLENASNTTGATPQIAVGPMAQLERDLLGHSLNDNAAIPALCRILRACFKLHTLSAQTEALTPVQPVDTSAKQLANNWCRGRLLALPDALLSEYSLKQPIKPNADWLLVSRPVNDEAELIERFAHQPWWFLLSLVSFVQDAWAAEHRGGLLLILPAGQNAFSPAQVSVVVQGIDGDEVSLGSLAEFLMQLLGELNIALYPELTNSAEDIQRLNRALSPLIAELLANKIWQFLDAGRGEPGHYRIHPDFSDACYSLPLAPLFGYKSQHLQQAIRQLAQISYANKRSASSANRINS
ncbi:membrane protein [Photobacterium leiognathi subsp. mandapamensis]|nr:membrane protein [Photobacterium leiognathi subsp. mandapamensis]